MARVKLSVLLHYVDDVGVKYVLYFFVLIKIHTHQTPVSLTKHS